MLDSETDRGPSERACPFITFYSFKGGVGRSMAVINVAGILAARGFRVLVVDMDLEAPGLSFLADPNAGGESSQPGFVDFLLDAVELGVDADLFRLPPEDAVLRYAAPYELPQGFRRNDDGSLHIMPAGRLDAEYSDRLNRLDLPGLYRQGDGLALIKTFKLIVQESRQFDYVLVDSRTGFSDESGICTRDLADYLMVVSGLNKQNVEGTTNFLATLRTAMKERKPLQVILSPIPNGEDALVDKREKAAGAAFTKAWGEPVATDLQIPYHPQLALTEEPHIFRRRRGYLFDAYNRIERSLLRLVGRSLEDTAAQAVDTFNKKDYANALALFRDAIRLAGDDKWGDHALFRLELELLAEPATNVLFQLVLGQLSPRGRAIHGGRLGRVANRLSQKDPELGQAMHQRALVVDPNNALNLGNYATFLTDDRKDVEAGGAMYQRALEVDPHNALNLGNYATFLRLQSGDMEAAEAMYQRALKVDPEHALNLGNYATFLRIERKDIGEAEVMYRRALEVEPKDAYNLGNYASFLANEKRDVEGAAGMYRRALNANPKNASNLGGYATFLRLQMKDMEAAEAMYQRALEADPKDPNNLGNYATFLFDERKDIGGAKAMYQRALEVDPEHVDNLGNYARVHLITGRVTEGLELLHRALDVLARANAPTPIDAECWMYLYCCDDLDRQPEALRQLRALIEVDSVRTDEWDFSGVIERAVALEHPEAAWLPELAEVLGGRQAPDHLADWDAWRLAVGTGPLPDSQ